MKLGKQIGLDPGHIVLDGDPGLPPTKGHSPQFSASNFRPVSVLTKWLDGSGYRYGGRPRTCDIVLDGEPAPHEKGHSSPQFSAHVYCG